jgi:hypothetical protein
VATLEALRRARVPQRPSPRSEAGSCTTPGDLPSRLRRWQSVRSWARLIREAEALWHVDVRALHRLAAQELVQLVQEVPPGLRRRVNLWLERFRVSTRLR